MVAFAIMLLAAACAGWIAAGGAPPRARSYLKLAATLDAALASATAFSLATSEVGGIVTTINAALLAMAAATALRRAPHPGIATVVLAGALIAGIFAAATGLSGLAAVPQVLACAAVALAARAVPRGRPRLYLSLCAVSLVGVSASMLGETTSARAGLLLFSSAALLGAALGLNVGVVAGQKTESSAISHARFG